MKLSYTLLAFLFLFSCKSSDKKAEENKDDKVATTSKSNESKEWISLFDGKSLDGWRGFNQDSLPDNWKIEDGTLMSLGTGGDIGGDIVYDERSFGEFEMEFEWKIAEGGNSGVFYHVKEGEQYDAPYETGPEYQLIDAENFAEPLEDYQITGANYGLHPPIITETTVKPAMSWNTSKIIFTEDKVEHWLNGDLVVEFTPWSDDWRDRIKNSKWTDYPDYGLAKSGLIGLQDHGSKVWFRNIRIREL